MVMDELDGEGRSMASLCFVWAEDYLQRFRAASNLNSETRNHGVGLAHGDEVAAHLDRSKATKTEEGRGLAGQQSVHGW